MNEQVSVKVSRSSELMFHCRSPSTGDSSVVQKEATANLLSALNFVQSEINNFLTTLISQEGTHPEGDLSGNDSTDSDSEEDSSCLDSSKGCKRSPSGDQVNRSKTTKITRI